MGLSRFRVQGVGGLGCLRFRWFRVRVTPQAGLTFKGGIEMHWDVFGLGLRSARLRKQVNHNDSWDHCATCGVYLY